MRRRRFIAAAGTGAAAGLAGCNALPWFGDESSGPGGGTETPAGGAPFEHPGTLQKSFATNGEYPPDENPSDGFPPAFADPPAPANADVSSFGTKDANGESVRLAPIDVVETWYRRGEARFVDARGLDQYRRSHVYGAVLSTAQKKSAGGGIDGWATDDRVVTYCGCPHHLSSVRAAGLQKAGFSRVFAIDEGFGEWTMRGHPMAGTSFASDGEQALSEWTLTGRVDARYAGEYVWAAVDRQYEAAPVRGDGRFSLTLAFAGVTAETPVEVTTPAFAVTRPLGELAAGPITGP